MGRKKKPKLRSVLASRTPTVKKPFDGDDNDVDCWWWLLTGVDKDDNHHISIAR